MGHRSLPDSQRCEFVYKDGRRCRSFRRKARGASLCIAHFEQGEQAGPAKKYPDPAEVALEILPPGAGLSTAQEVNAALTRIFRAVAEQRIPPRCGAALGYVAQLIISTLSLMEQEAAAAAAPPAYPLGEAPEVIVSELAEALRSALPAPGSREAAGPRLPEPGVIEERND